jgi:hypothetical protein
MPLILRSPGTAERRQPPPRYYVLEVIAGGRFHVASNGYPDYADALDAAIAAGRRRPGRIYIAGELTTDPLLAEAEE